MGFYSAPKGVLDFSDVCTTRAGAAQRYQGLVVARRGATSILRTPPQRPA